MEKNEYLCNVNKAEEQQFAVLSSRVSSAEREKHEAQKKARLLEQEDSALKSKNEDMQRRLNEKMDEVADTVRQMAQFMMGKGPVTLSDSLRDAIVAGVKEEFEAKLREEREAHSKEMQSLKDQFALMLAAKDNEIAALKARNGEDQGDSHGTTNPGRPVPEGMAPENRIKQLEQQKNKYAIDAVRRKFKDPRGKYYYINLPEEYKNPMGRTEATESVIALVYTLHGEQRMTDSEIVTFLKSKGLNFSEGAVKNWIKKAADILAPLDEPTQEEILATGNDHVDESGIEVCDQRLPNKGEKEEDVEKDKHYFDRWMFCHHADSIKLTQFVFFERGRRTRKAVEAYLSKAKKRLFVNSDGCPIYKCYDVTVKDLEKCSEITDIIIRVSCLVHMRRPFFKLKDCSQDAIDIVHLADEVFHLDKQIKTTYKEDFEKIAQERVLQIGPILQSIKDKLDILEKELDQAKEPELVKAVKYAKKEYPCLLHCLKNGALDFSNNSVEREIRRLAKYRNNSFFVGSPKGGARLARTLTIFANCKAYNIDPYKYLCDVFRRIKTTAKDQLVNLVAHKWQPQMAPAIY